MKLRLKHSLSASSNSIKLTLNKNNWIVLTATTKEDKMSKSSISYVICNCQADFTSWFDNNFRWPALGEVVCPDFDTTETFRNGLLGHLNGCGGGLTWHAQDQWLLVAVPSDTIIDLESKVKFPKGEVIFSSQELLQVIAELERLNPETKNMPVVGANRSSMLSGARLVTGWCGTSISSGDGGVSITGSFGVATSWNYGTSTSKQGGISTSGYRGVSTSGLGGTSISGLEGRSVSGESGTSYSGWYGTSISGVKGRSIVELDGKAKSGKEGNLIFQYSDEYGHIKYASFFVDGKTVKADTFYECVDGKLVEVLQENINTKG
jgi:hypothetical protein